MKPIFKPSTRKNKKYMVKVNDTWVHFGDKRYSHYFDSALGLYKQMNHNDEHRRKLYRARAKEIKDKDGNLTYLDKTSPNYWAYHYLW